MFVLVHGLIGAQGFIFILQLIERFDVVRVEASYQLYLVLFRTIQQLNYL